MIRSMSTAADDDDADVREDATNQFQLIVIKNSWNLNPSG